MSPTVILISMVTEKISDTYHVIHFDNGNVIHLVGTAHVSNQSVEEVRSIIEEQHPDRVCIELDDGRMKSKTQEKSWENMDIKKILKDGKGFLLLANTALASFQKRMGAQTGADPGAEIVGAAKLAEDMGIPVSLCDREIQITFRRAWGKSSLWNKCKLLATLVSAAFSNEEISEEELAELKNEETLESMMKEVAKELPSVKEVLIDERDRYLATSIFKAEGKTKVAVIGAGHTQGIIRTFERLEKGELSLDISDLTAIPPKGAGSKIAQWIIPTLIVLLVVLGIVLNGWDQGIKAFLWWMAANASSTFVFTLIGGASFLTCLLSGVTAPFFVLNPVLGVGIFAGIWQASFKPPKVKDFENMSNDALTLKGWYKNRILKCLVALLTSSLGSILGSLVAFPFIIARI